MSQLRPRFATTLATLSLSAAVAFASANAVAQQPEHAHSADHSVGHGQQVAKNNPSAQRKAAVEATETFVNAGIAWAQARSVSQKAVALENLITKAEARREILAQLIQTSPAEALQLEITKEKRTGMPVEVQAMLEQKLALGGELEVFYEDYADGSHKLRQFLKTPAGERFELHTAGKQKSAVHGQQVELSGLFLASGDETTDSDGQIALGSSADILIMGATGGSNGGTAGVLPNTFGEMKVGVIMVNFQNNPNDKPWSVSQMNNLVFGQVSDFYRENSYNQAWLGGDVLGWYTLPMDGGSCPSGVGTAADAAVAANGINLSQYTHLVYVMAPSSGCTTNTGTVGGSPSRAYIVDGSDFRIFTHELGHNLGLRHAHGLNCTGDVQDTNCVSLAYGDTLDVMGSVEGHLSAFNKERLGWLNHNQSPPITSVSSDGSYVISPLEANDSNPKALKILQGVDATTGEEQWYYLEYRQPIGFDEFLFDANNPYKYPDNLANGVVVHSAKEVDGNSSYLLDMTPDSLTYNSVADLRDPALEVGTSYYDSDAGVTITPLSNNSNGITVSVSFDNGSDTPTNNAPVAANDTANTAAESAISIAVLANDYDADGDVLTITSTSGVNGSAQVSGGNILFTPNTGFSGTETFNYSISDGKGGNDSATVTVTVAAAPASNQLPVALNDSATTAHNTAVTIAVLSNDYDPDGDTLSLSGTSGVNGTAQISGGSITFTPVNGFSGTEVFSYTVSDGNGGTDTATVSVSVAPATNTNQAPVALNDSVVLSSVTEVTIPVLANDYDPDGDNLSITVISGGNKGTIRKNSDGTLTYMPGRRFKNSDSFSYTVTDGKQSTSATVSIQLQQSGGSGGKGGKGNGKKS